MGRTFRPIPGKPPCPGCGQPEGVILQISNGGFSVGTGYEHKPECPALRCPHGKLWDDDCETCNKEHEVEGYGSDQQHCHADDDVLS